MRLAVFGQGVEDDSAVAAHYEVVGNRLPILGALALSGVGEVGGESGGVGAVFVFWSELPGGILLSPKAAGVALRHARVLVLVISLGPDSVVLRWPALSLVGGVHLR